MHGLDEVVKRKCQIKELIEDEFVPVGKMLGIEGRGIEVAGRDLEHVSNLKGLFLLKEMPEEPEEGKEEGGLVEKPLMWLLCERTVIGIDEVRECLHPTVIRLEKGGDVYLKYWQDYLEPKKEVPDTEKMNYLHVEKFVDEEKGRVGDYISLGETMSKKDWRLQGKDGKFLFAAEEFHIRRKAPIKSPEDIWIEMIVPFKVRTRVVFGPKEKEKKEHIVISGKEVYLLHPRAIIMKKDQEKYEEHIKSIITLEDNEEFVQFLSNRSSGSGRDGRKGDDSTYPA